MDRNLAQPALGDRDVKSAKRELLASAVNSGLTLNRYEEVRPSLEDVFLQLVGSENVT
jgi:ABC-type uncharacterized transport system ATPase subunit